MAEPKVVSAKETARILREMDALLTPEDRKQLVAGWEEGIRLGRKG